VEGLAARSDLRVEEARPAPLEESVVPLEVEFSEPAARVLAAALEEAATAESVAVLQLA
jgi:hypothetical protein